MSERCKRCDRPVAPYDKHRRAFDVASSQGDFAGMLAAQQDWTDANPNACTSSGALCAPHDFRADRDRLAAEVERVRTERDAQITYAVELQRLIEALCNERPIPPQKDATYHQPRAVKFAERVAELRTERDAAIAARDEAVAERDEVVQSRNAERASDRAKLLDAIAARDSAVTERDELRAIVDPVRGRELIAGLQQARDSAVNDTAEAIARWLEERAEALCLRANRNRDHGDYDTARSYGTEASECAAVAKSIRAGAWRGQNGGG